jgi:tetratricopeptide (TPR) repeat protein
VLRVYDLAEHDGLRFLTMELVDGEDLGALMKREKRLPLARALAIFRQVCDGLAAAHAQGVVHRDLKPQNVLVDKEDNVRVADFGLARSIGDSGLTASGAILGSPAYMSPEQVKGDPTDERSDIYSLGIMLYQLVAGEPPFQAPTPHMVMEMRLHKKPRPLRDVAPEAPAYVEAICAKCLALNLSARYASMKELLAALSAGSVPPPEPRKRRWLVPAIAAGVVAAGATVAVIAWPRASKQPAAASKPELAKPRNNLPIRVLVLGFDNRTRDPIFDGTANVTLHYALRRSPRLDPAFGNEIASLAADVGLDRADDDRLGPKLVERDGNRVLSVRGVVASKAAGFTLSIAVTDASTGETVLSRSVEAPDLAGVVPAIGQLAGSLREAVGEHPAADERDRTAMSPKLDADHELALALAAKLANDIAGATDHLKQAVAKDPSFALAHVQLGVMFRNSDHQAEGNEQFRLGLKTIDQLGERDRLKFLADYYEWVTEEHERSIAQYEQLLATWPMDGNAANNLAIGYLAIGDMKRALAMAQRVANDHPHSILYRENLAGYELMAGDFETARKQARSVIADFPRPSPTTFESLAIASALVGDRTAALDAFAQLAQHDASRGALSTADFAMAEGRLADAAALLDRGLADDMAHNEVDAAEFKLNMLAELRLRRGDKAGAREAAAQVAGEPRRMMFAALVLLAAGDDKRATATAARLGEHIAPTVRALGKLIEGEALRLHGKPQQAIIVLQDALRVVDKPISHYLLARAALDAKHYAEAYTELQTCLARRGESADGADDVPQLRYVPPYTYYLAKAQEGLGSSEATASYRAFLAMMHDPDPADPLVADARKHVQ